MKTLHVACLVNSDHFCRCVCYMYAHTCELVCLPAGYPVYAGDITLDTVNLAPGTAVFFFCERCSFSGMSEILPRSTSATADLGRSSGKQENYRMPFSTVSSGSECF